MNKSINKINFLNNVFFKKTQQTITITTGSNVFTYLNNLRSNFLVLDVVGVDNTNRFFGIVFRDTINYNLNLWLFSSKINYQIHDNWMFREYNEFFLNIFKTTSDNRNLLLDYNISYKPLKKNFPTIGFEEVYYDFSSGFIKYVKLNSVEL